MLQGGDGYDHYKVRARMAVMDRRFKEAEGIYLEQVYKCHPHQSQWLCDYI